VSSLCVIETRRKFPFIAHCSLLLEGHHLFVLRTLICLIFTLMYFRILYYTSVFLIIFLCNENTANFANVSSLAERPSLFRSHIKRVCDFCQKRKYIPISISSIMNVQDLKHHSNKLRCYNSVGAIKGKSSVATKRIFGPNFGFILQYNFFYTKHILRITFYLLIV
jgi:hypothetical protein